MVEAVRIIFNLIFKILMLFFLNSLIISISLLGPHVSTSLFLFKRSVGLIAENNFISSDFLFL